MDQYKEKIKKFLQDNNIQGKHICFNQSCHSVEDAIKATKANTDDFVKNICMVDSNKNLIVAIIKGEDKVSTSQIKKSLNIKKLRIATPDEILQKTGYPCGGIPSFGYDAIFIIDPEVMKKNVIFTGGGSKNSLIKISTKELQKTNKGEIIKIRK